MFIAHGNFQVKDSDHPNIIIVEATGPFNIQAVHIYRQQVLDKTANINGYWGQLNTANQNCLYTPEAAQELQNLTVLKKEQGLRFAAILFKDCLCKTLIEEKIKMFYDRNNIVYEIFSDQNDAMHWLATSLNQANQIPQSTCA